MAVVCLASSPTCFLEDKIEKRIGEGWDKEPFSSTIICFQLSAACDNEISYISCDDFLVVI